MHAVELRSGHVYAAHDQRRTDVALVPWRGVGVVIRRHWDSGPTLYTPPDPSPASSGDRASLTDSAPSLAQLLRLASSGSPDLAAPPPPVPPPRPRPSRNGPAPGPS